MCAGTKAALLWINAASRGNPNTRQEGTKSMNQHHYHAVVWIDHHEARVFHVSATDIEKHVLQSDHPTRHIHRKANSIGSGHAASDFVQKFDI